MSGWPSRRPRTIHWARPSCISGDPVTGSVCTRLLRPAALPKPHWIPCAPLHPSPPPGHPLSFILPDFSPHAFLHSPIVLASHHPPVTQRTRPPLLLHSLPACLPTVQAAPLALLLAHLPIFSLSPPLECRVLGTKCMKMQQDAGGGPSGFHGNWVWVTCRSQATSRLLVS